MHADISAPQNGSSNAQKNSAGLWGLICSIAGLLLCGCWLLTIPGLILSIIGLRKEPKTYAIVGLVLSAVGILAFLLLGPLMLGILLPSLARANQQARIVITQNIVNMHQSAIQVYHEQHGSYPDSMEALVKTDFAHPDDLHDAWKQPLHLIHKESGEVIVVSSGPDKTIGTEDDLSAKEK